MRHKLDKRPGRRDLRSDHGQTMVLFVLMLPVMLAFASLAIDGANVFAQKRQVQNAVDAAVLAAASQLDGTACSGSDTVPGTCAYKVRTIAETYSSENGGPATLHACGGSADVNCYLTPYKGSNWAVQIRLSKEVPGLLSGLFGFSFFHPSATASAAPQTATNTVTIPASGNTYDRIYHDNNPAITANMGCGFPGLDLNNEVINAPFTARGNVCLRGTSALLAGGVNGRVDIQGGLHTWQTNSKVGVSTTNRINSAQAGLGCRTGSTTSLVTNPWVPCVAATHRIWATNIGNAPLNLTRDTFDWQAEYNRAAPGPMHGCNPSVSSAPSTWPVFDNNGTFSGAGGTAIDFTPSTSYTCRATAPDGTPGELSWNATTKVLTVAGVIFFDRRWAPGSFNAGVIHYYGKATIFFSSPQQVTWSGEKYCSGGTAGVDCTSPVSNMSNWTPSQNTLWLVLGGKNGAPFDTGAANPSPSTNSDLDFTAPSAFQGGIYSLNRCHVHGAGAYLAGPLVCGTLDTAGLGTSALQFPPVTLYEGSGSTGGSTTTTTTATDVISLDE